MLLKVFIFPRCKAKQNLEFKQENPKMAKAKVLGLLKGEKRKKDC